MAHQKSEKKILTLVVPCAGNRVLLGMKKRGFGSGRWNGFGGKVEAGESIEEAAVRELREEAGIRTESIEKRGIITFEFEHNPKILEVHIFCTEQFLGEPEETEEMRPAWFSTHEIPFESMWPDDRYWFPYFIAGKKFRGAFSFDRPSDAEYTSRVPSHELVEVSTL